VSLEVFHRDAGRPNAARTVEIRPVSRQGDDVGRVLACDACRAPITTDAERIEVDGAHGHAFANPAGYVFEIGCFAAAPGCVVHGEPTQEDTWFAGFAWSYADCAACRQHLGWCYQRTDVRFFGLILRRLVENEP
jgi:hypothetical protein